MENDHDMRDGRPTIAGSDPLLERLIKVHKEPRHDFYWHARALQGRAGTAPMKRGRKQHVTHVPAVQGRKRQHGASAVQ